MLKLKKMTIIFLVFVPEKKRDAWRLTNIFWSGSHWPPPPPTPATPVSIQPPMGGLLAIPQKDILYTNKPPSCEQCD